MIWAIKCSSTIKKESHWRKKSKYESASKEDYIKFNADEYLQIPENSKDYIDIIVHGVTIHDGNETLSNQSLALQYEEVLDNNRILFQPKCLTYGRNLDLIGHQTFLISDLNIPDSIEFKTGKIIEIF